MNATASGLALAVAAAGAWSTLDVLRKHLAQRVDTLALLWGLAAVQAPLFAAWALTEPTATDWVGYAPAGVATLLLNLYANWAFIKSLEMGALSRTIPMLSFTPALTIASGAAVVGEWPAPSQLTGIGLVVVGSVTLARSVQAKVFRWAPGTLLMVSVAAAWSVSAAVDKVALQSATVAAHGLTQSCGLLLAVTGVVVARGRAARLSRLRVVFWGLLLAAVVMAAASALQYMAIQRTLISYVETIKRAVGAGVALAVGARMFRESVGLREIGAATLIVAGTSLVLLGSLGVQA